MNVEKIVAVDLGNISRRDTRGHGQFHLEGLFESNHKNHRSLALGQSDASLPGDCEGECSFVPLLVQCRCHDLTCFHSELDRSSALPLVDILQVIEARGY